MPVANRRMSLALVLLESNQPTSMCQTRFYRELPAHLNNRTHRPFCLSLACSAHHRWFWDTLFLLERIYFFVTLILEMMTLWAGPRYTRPKLAQSLLKLFYLAHTFYILMVPDYV